MSDSSGCSFSILLAETRPTERRRALVSSSRTAPAESSLAITIRWVSLLNSSARAGAPGRDGPASTRVTAMTVAEGSGALATECKLGDGQLCAYEMADSRLAHQCAAVQPLSTNSTSGAEPRDAGVAPRIGAA